MKRLPGYFGAHDPAAAPAAVLSIAGFDPSSGAGFTADLKVFAAHELFGLACATALTVQSTAGVRRSEAIVSTLVEDTLDCLAEDIPIAGVKIGMLATRANVVAAARWVARYREQVPELPVVVDPVLRSSYGAALLDPDAVQVLVAELLPLATVVTPNLSEAALLAGFSIDSPEDTPASAAESYAQAIRAHMDPLRGAVVITGGHSGPERTPDDFLLAPGEPAGLWVAGEWVHTRATHGTGCAFSSALLCGLVHDLPLPAAVLAAKRYVESAMRAAYPIGQGKGPMHHLFRATRRPPATSQ